MNLSLLVIGFLALVFLSLSEAAKVKDSNSMAQDKQEINKYKPKYYLERKYRSDKNNQEKRRRTENKKSRKGNKKSSKGYKKSRKGNEKSRKENRKSTDTSGRMVTGQAVLSGSHCEYVDLCLIDRMAEDGCSSGQKFVIKSLKGIRRQFLVVDGSKIIAFLKSGKKITDCMGNLTDVTSRVSCKTVNGASSIKLQRQNGSASVAPIAPIPRPTPDPGQAVLPLSAGQVHCPCPGRICVTRITSTNNKHKIECGAKTFTVPCGGPLMGSKIGFIISIIDVFAQPLCSTNNYVTLIKDLVWKCKNFTIPGDASCPGDVINDTTMPAPTPTTGSNCSGALIIESNNSNTYKIPWQEAAYPNLPANLEDMQGTQVGNSLVVCGSVPKQSQLEYDYNNYKVMCYKAQLPDILWTELVELTNFTRSPMLAGQGSDNLVWAVGGRDQFDGFSDISDAVQTLDLFTGQVNHKKEMVFNKNISGGCAIMIDNQFLYIIGGEGTSSFYGEFNSYDADVMRNVSILNTATGEWTTDLPRMASTRADHQCIETRINGTRGILVAGGICFLNRQCGFAFNSIPGCCDSSSGNIHLDEDFYGGLLSSVEFFNLETNSWSQLPNMKHTRGRIGLAVINNKVTSFNTIVYTVTQEDYYFYFTIDSTVVPMFYEELDDQSGWRNVSYPTSAKPANTFLTFPISDSLLGFTDDCV